MNLSTKYEWFRDWFRTGFVWFRVFPWRGTKTENSVLLCSIQCLFRATRTKIREQGMAARLYMKWLGGMLSLHVGRPLHNEEQAS